MRSFSAAAFVVALAAAGAVAGIGLTAPGRAGQHRVALSTPTGQHPSPGASPRAEAAAETGVIRLSVRAADGRPILSTTVGALDPVPAGQAYQPVDPPHWDQAVWVRYRPLVPPTDTARGTSYVYGHACHYHVCSFTQLARATPGGSVTVTQGGRTIRYRIVSASSQFPKSGPGSLAERRSGLADRSVPHRLVLVTCAYESGDVSLNNFVVVARR